MKRFNGLAMAATVWATLSMLSVITGYIKSDINLILASTALALMAFAATSVDRASLILEKEELEKELSSLSKEQERSDTQ